jgi:NAD(P)-dependent dehydrogenase (short-subunit alcohol dehydrogenase family)
MSRQAGDGENRGPPALVITGASSGIGYATARLAIEQDWLVFGSVRKEGDAEVLKDELERRLRHSYSTCVIRLPYLRKLIRDNATRTQSLWNRGGDCRAGNVRHSDLADPESAIGRYGATDYGEGLRQGYAIDRRRRPPAQP